MRKVVGDSVDIFVDFNNSSTAKRAIELGLKLYEQFTIKVVEDPGRVWTIRGCGRW